MNPPECIEAEQSVLGCMMIDPSALRIGLNLLAEADFYRNAHRPIFKALAALAERSDPADIVGVQEELRAEGRFDDVGGVEYLAALIDSIPTTAHMEYYTRIVQEKARRRRLIEGAGLLAQAAADAESTSERLSELAAELAEVPVSRPVAVLTHGELVEGELPAVNWTVERLVPEGGISIIGGDAGTGKSWVALHLAGCVASGRDFLGEFKVTPGRVLLVDAESSLNLIERRTKKLYAGLRAEDPEVPKDLPVTILPAALKLTGQGLNQLTALIVEAQASLVIIDPLIHAADGEENSAEAMAALFEAVREVQRQTGAGFVFCHHSRKESRLASNSAGQMLRGSSAIRGILDSHIFLRKLKGERILAEHDKSRHGEVVPAFVLEIADEDEETTLVRYLGEADESAEKIEYALTVIRRTLANAGGCASRKTLLEQARADGVPERTACRALKLAADREEVKKTRRGTEMWYLLPDEGLFGEDE